MSRFRCSDCGREWSGFSEAHCSRCHEHFGGYTGFDLHLSQRGEIVTHKDPGTLRNRKTGEPLLVQDSATPGATWRLFR